MNWREFVSSLVASLAWPGAVALVALVFRRQIVTLMTSGLHRVKAGPVELEWNRAERRMPESVRAAARTHVPDSIEAAGADIAPRVAILARHEDLVNRLGAAVTAALGAQPPAQTLGELIDVAEQAGLIDAKTKDALVGVTIMSNLAAHEPLTVDATKASEFMALADATEYAMNHHIDRFGGAL